MGFEIPFRGYIADILMTHYPSVKDFKTALALRLTTLQPSDPFFLRNILPKVIKNSEEGKMYNAFSVASKSPEIVAVDQDIPMVWALNIVTFALTNDFQNLYNLFASYSLYCECAEKYRYARNKLDHPGCRTLEDRHLIPVLSFVKDICTFLDEKYFIQKSKKDILSEVVILQKRRMVIPIPRHNLGEMPYLETQIVCRDTEISELKSFIYGNSGDIRKQHSRCVFGYGGIGKTALVVETIKQIVQDIVDNKTCNDYLPEYMLFFSAKRRKLSYSETTGKIIEQQVPSHFESADELISLIHDALGEESFKHYHKEGLIIVDNLESLSETERKSIKHFIEMQTPTEMQFLITSRNSEEFESNKKLSGFEAEVGKNFVQSYIDENSLDIKLSDSEIEELLNISKGNTLVLVLSLRRLSQKLVDISGLKADYSYVNAWRIIRKNIAPLPPNAYETLSDFMFKDTFEQIEDVFDDTDLFFKILKVFAIIPNEGIDLSTVCLLTDTSYPDVEAAVDTLCNYLIVEKKGNSYILNQFAETYIIQRFVPDAETFEALSKSIESRQREIRLALDKLSIDMEDRPELRKIMNDWYIITDSDRIAAAKMYDLYGRANRECNRGGKFKVQAMLEDFVRDSEETEQITAHPYIKYQKARILQLIDRANVLEVRHTEEILKGYRDAIYIIKTVDQYSPIQKTKSFAALLWLYGQFLSDQRALPDAVRSLEEAKNVFEDQSITDRQYYQCITLLGWKYLDMYNLDRKNNIGYLRRARGINQKLKDNYFDLGVAAKFAKDLNRELAKYGSIG